MYYNTTNLALNLTVKLECDCDELILDTIPEKSQIWIRVSYLIKIDLMSSLERRQKELASMFSWNRWRYLSICVPQEVQTKLCDVIKIVQTNRASECSPLTYWLLYSWFSVTSGHMRCWSWPRDISRKTGMKLDWANDTSHFEISSDQLKALDQHFLTRGNQDIC